MAILQRDARLFGLDLSTLGDDLRSAWRGMAQWPVFRWLWPTVPVRVLMADGAEQFFYSKSRPLSLDVKRLSAAKIIAVQLPEDILLRRRVRMPQLPPSAVDSALRLEATSQSPFPEADMLWVSQGVPTSGGEQGRELVVTSRALVLQYLQQRMSQLVVPLSPNVQPEVWVSFEGALHPVVLPGFGELRRQRQQRLGGMVNAALCLAAAGLVGVIAVTPTLQQRLVVLDAAAQHATLMQQVAPVQRQREAYVSAAEQLKAVTDTAGAPLSALEVMDKVTSALPDDSSLLTLSFNASEWPDKPPKLVLTGQTPNAALLMQALGKVPGLKDIKAPTPAIKPLGADKESFTIEATLDVSQLRS